MHSEMIFVGFKEGLEATFLDPIWNQIFHGLDFLQSIDLRITIEMEIIN